MNLVNPRKWGVRERRATQIMVSQLLWKETFTSGQLGVIHQRTTVAHGMSVFQVVGLTKQYIWSQSLFLTQYLLKTGTKGGPMCFLIEPQKSEDSMESHIATLMLKM